MQPLVRNDDSRDAGRWQVLVAVLLDALPEIRARFEPDEYPLTMGDIWWAVGIASYDDEDRPIGVETGFWSRLLGIVEVVEAAAGLIAHDSEREDDFVLLHAFATTGILCDITRTRVGVTDLLPFMGPLSVMACRAEVDAHQGSRGFGPDAIDWSLASDRFVPSGVDHRTVLPSG